MSPRGGPCNHRRCADYGEGCRQLTDEELTASPEDEALVDQLIAEGYIQISAKYRTVAKLPPPVHAHDLIRADALTTPAGKELASLWHSHHENWRSAVARQNTADHVQLTLRQYRYFKKKTGTWFDRYIEVHGQ